MEYLSGGDLMFHMENNPNGFLEPAQVKLYAAEIAVALMFLHHNKIVYRDLKPTNILLDAEGHIKLADFGLCKENISYDDKTGTFCGTPHYMAPEIVKTEFQGGMYGPAADWWSYGVVIYEMTTGHLIIDQNIDDEDYSEIFRAILYGKIISALKKRIPL